MVELLTTAGITSEIEKLINSSNGEKLILITPYLKIAKQFQNAIEDQNNFKTNISVVVRDGENHNHSDVNFLQGLKNVSLYTHENLHAKCYLNHKTAIIASMNLYEYSQLNNTELGIKVDKEPDDELYNQINEAVKRIVRNSDEFEFEIKKVDKSRNKNLQNTENNKENNHKKQNLPDKGSCIRCGEKIEFNLNRPLCDKCYPKWAKFGDTKYQETFCLSCGKDKSSHKSSYEKPLCYTCYKKIFK